MKKIEEGKVYNTDTAEAVASWDNGHMTSDFQYCSEVLYRTKKGKFFLFGEGGAMSIYSGTYGNSTGWGYKIKVFKEGEAWKIVEWLERTGNQDEAIKLFPDLLKEA